MSARKATRRPKARRITTRMIERILNNDNPPDTLEPYARIADFFDIPLWVMFLPNVPKKMFNRDSDDLKRLVQHVEGYIAIERRLAEVES